MRYYPLLLDLSQKHVLVVGAGAVGCRKITALLKTPVSTLTVVDPAPADERLSRLLAEKPMLTHLRRAFCPEDLAGNDLVFAATPHRAVNALVAELCSASGVLCNVTDAPSEGNFIVPAHFTKGDITIAVNTGGSSPALSRRIREELEAWLGNRYTRLVIVLGRLRPMLLELDQGPCENSALLRELVYSTLAERLEAGDLVSARSLLQERLPESLHPRVGELIHDL